MPLSAAQKKTLKEAKAKLAAAKAKAVPTPEQVVAQAAKEASDKKIADLKAQVALANASLKAMNAEVDIVEKKPKKKKKAKPKKKKDGEEDPKKKKASKGKNKDDKTGKDSLDEEDAVKGKVTGTTIRCTRCDKNFRAIGYRKIRMPNTWNKYFGQFSKDPENQKKWPHPNVRVINAAKAWNAMSKETRDALVFPDPE